MKFISTSSRWRAYFIHFLSIALFFHSFLLNIKYKCFTSIEFCLFWQDFGRNAEIDIRCTEQSSIGKCVKFYYYFLQEKIPNQPIKFRLFSTFTNTCEKLIICILLPVIKGSRIKSSFLNGRAIKRGEGGKGRTIFHMLRTGSQFTIGTAFFIRAFWVSPVQKPEANICIYI